MIRRSWNHILIVGCNRYMCVFCFEHPCYLRTRVNLLMYCYDFSKIENGWMAQEFIELLLWHLFVVHFFVVFLFYSVCFCLANASMSLISCNVWMEGYFWMVGVSLFEYVCLRVTISSFLWILIVENLMKSETVYNENKHKFLMNCTHKHIYLL